MDLKCILGLLVRKVSYKYGIKPGCHVHRTLFYHLIMFLILILKTFYSDLLRCQPTSRTNDEPEGSSSSDEVLHYIELTMRVDTVGVESIRRPLVRCDSEAVAKWVRT
jgi:hypothetical protein